MSSDDTQYLLGTPDLVEFLLLVTCRMTLLLGPPGAGKTTFLLALSGKLDKTLKVEFLLTLLPLRDSSL
jgi:ABC-type hemin transport system ATPase subunit